MWRNLVALASDKTIMTVPAGAVLDGPAQAAVTGIVTMVYEGRAITVLAIDLLDAAKAEACDD